MAKKKKAEATESLDTVVSYNEEPNQNVKDNWNQITLSLASNGGFTINQGTKYILSVLIKESINGKQVDMVKSFVVTKKELTALEDESKEFSSEINQMLEARDKEEKAATVKKEEKKKAEPSKKVTGKALTDVLKKGLESIKNKPPVYTDSEDTEDNGLDLDMEPDRD